MKIKNSSVFYKILLNKKKKVKKIGREESKEEEDVDDSIERS
jgi:hypothetical protein